MKLSRKVQIKPGVVMWGVEEVMIPAANGLVPVYECFAAVVVITSGREGKHSNNSKHYKGLALDFRTKNVSILDRKRLSQHSQSVLGDGYKVILHKTHMHVEKV